MQGFQTVDSTKIAEVYGDPPKINYLKWPARNRSMIISDEYHWIFTNFTESCNAPVVAMIVDLMVKGVLNSRRMLGFAFDLYEVNIRLQASDQKGEYVDEDGSGKYYHQLS